MGRDWTPAELILLEQLWDEGHTTAEIGRRLDVSKNAVVGKVHRLKLPARPSPIKRSGDGPSTALPKHASSAIVPRKPFIPIFARTTLIAPRPPVVRAAPQPPPPVAILAPPPAPKPVFVRRIEPCCYPTGDSPRIQFLCTEPAIRGKPFCEEHAARIYIPLPRQADDTQQPQ